MKTGKSLSELALEIERQNNSKRDFIAPTSSLFVGEKDGALNLTMTAQNAGETYGINNTAHKQIAQRLKIPMPFYERLRGNHPDLLATNLNALFVREPEMRMLRTLDGNLRAFVSDRYRRLDNYDLIQHILPMLQRNVVVGSCEVTERRLYLKCLFPGIEGEVKVGDVVRSGLLVSNSEIGEGSLRVAPFIETLACTNGMTLPNFGEHKYHIGRQADESDATYELLSDETREADDKALWLKIRDVVTATTSQGTFEKILESLKSATQDRITISPQKVVEVTAKRYGYTEQEQGDVLRYLIEGGELSRYGLANAITRTAQNAESYDRASELECDGGNVIMLPRTDWQRLAEAA